MLRRTVCFSLLILLAGVARPLFAQEQVRPTEQEARAEQLIEEGKFSEAIELLNGIITPQSRRTRPLLLRASAHEARGDMMTAARDYERVLQIDPGSQEARDGFRRTSASQNAARRQVTASNLESLERLVRLNPEDTSYRIRYADALFTNEMFREAAVQYGEYLDRVQGTPDVVQNYLISIAGYEGDNDLGERQAEKYVGIYERNDDLWMRLGYFRLWQGEMESAEDACEQAVLLNPQNREASSCLGLARDPVRAQSQSNYPIDVLTRELNADPDNDDKRFQLTDLLIDAGRYFEAKTQLDRLAPRHRGTDGWNRRMTLVTNRLQTEPARGGSQTRFIVDRLYGELENQPDNTEKRYQLVDQLLNYNRYWEAYDQLREILKTEPQADHTEQWLVAFLKADNGLAKQNDGESPIYEIDRLTYKLRLDPTQRFVRYLLVDELMNADPEPRYQEAFDLLVDQRYADPSDAEYRRRLAEVSTERERIAHEKIQEMEQRLAENPNDVAALQGLVGNYLVVDRPDDAIRAYARLIELKPEDLETRIDYVDALRVGGYPEQAADQAAWLLDRDPQSVRIQRLYVMSRFAVGSLGDRGEQVLAGLLANRSVNDASLLVEAANYRIGKGQLEEAERLIARAEQLDEPGLSVRIDTLKQLMARERVRAGEQAQFAILNDARRLVKQGQYKAAIARYEEYFEATGKRTRSELRELAEVYASDHQYDEAIARLQALQNEMWDYDVAKQMARTQIAREDYSAALSTLEPLAQKNPRDYEVKFMQAEALRELGLYAQATAIYDEALLLADDSETIGARKVSVDADIRTTLAQTEDGVGYDFVGIIVPTSDATRSRGGGTRYDRWAQGMQTQVTLPIGMVMSAGVNSHFISGSRRLVPGSEIVRGRVNQIFTGGYFDLTPPVKSDRASYTNRLSGEVGLYDYEGARTVVYGNIRYWRQEQGRYEGSVGLRTGEGSIDLWSPGGGQFNLRLTQFDVKGSSMTLMPDSVLRVQGAIALNVVRDNFGNTASNNDTNFGANVQLEAGYRILDYTFLGLTYYQIDYRSTVDTYFSPRNYTSYDLFLEYEREVPSKWYLRVRGAMGIIARSSGFIHRRIEVDWVKRLNSSFSMTLRSTMGASTRTLGSGATSFIDRYNTFTFGAAVYWTL